MRRFFLLSLCSALPVPAGPPAGRTVVLDSFEAPAGWTTVGGGMLEHSELLAKEEAHTLVWKAPVVKARNSACGVPVLPALSAHIRVIRGQKNNFTADRAAPHRRGGHRSPG